MKKTEYQPDEYTWIIRHDTEVNPNTGKYDVILKIIEFDVEFDFESAAEAEKNVYKIVEGLMETRTQHQKLPLPIPLKYRKNFTGRLTVRLSPETHRRLYMEATQTELSLNQLIEKKLAG